MDLTALTLVKIDGDIIEEFVRHTLKFVDRLIVVDNASPDTTPKLLRLMQDEGLPLRVWEIEMIAERAGMTTELARRAFAETPCDYLLLLDADEFIKASSRVTLERSLAALPVSANALVSWETYVPTHEDDDGEQRVLARVRHRRCIESKPYSKLIIPRAFSERRELSIAPGNHFVENNGTMLDAIELPDVRLAHFPVRSVGQVQSKALLGWTQFLASGFDREGEIAYHWRWMYDRLRQKSRWSDEDFLQVAWHYLDNESDEPEVVFDPLVAVACRYAPSAHDPLNVAIEYMRQLAIAYSRGPTRANPEPS